MTLFSPTIIDLAAEVVQGCRTRGWRVATAESCTGGLVIGALTEIAGCSDVVDRGFVTYSNAAKQAMLGVSDALLQAHGAVSEPVACAMASGALNASEADLTVSITGIAGPGGGSRDKPVGLVHFANGIRGQAVLGHVERFGDIGRTAVRQAAIEVALRLLLARL